MTLNWFRQAMVEWATAKPEITDLARSTVPRDYVPDTVIRSWPPDPRQLDHILWAATDNELRLMELASSEMTREEYERLYGTMELLIAGNIITPIVVATGRAPALMLTSAQQTALWFTEPSPPDTSFDDASFDDGVLVVLHDPIRFVRWSDSGERISDGADLLAIFCSKPTAQFVTLLLRLGDGRPITQSTIPIGTWDEVFPTGDGDFTDDERAQMGSAWRLAMVAREAAYTFGTQETEPSVLRVDRAERRRRDRVHAKRRAPSTVAVRYLRDHSDGWQFDEAKAKEGSTVRPHLRRGHFRNVRTGSMSLPKDERPTVRRHVKACIVNGHLGMPNELVVYYDRTRSSSARIASSSSSDSSNSGACLASGDAMPSASRSNLDGIVDGN